MGILQCREQGAEGPLRICVPSPGEGWVSSGHFQPPEMLPEP